jgi:hypothetical protein
MANNLVALVLGAGPRVGSSVAEKFAKNGYKVAIASRSGKNSINDQGYLSLQADFTKPSTVPELFKAVKAEFHTAPSVVVYNAAALTTPPVENSLFSISGDTVTSSLNVNTISPYVVAQQAVAEWETVPETKKTFIYTGNIQNKIVLPIPMMVDLGMGKAASAYWIGAADAIYSPKGYRLVRTFLISFFFLSIFCFPVCYVFLRNLPTLTCRFFYTDERQEDGSLKGMALDGPAHADFYETLAKHEGDIPWHATFVKDKGYVGFK